MYLGAQGMGGGKGGGGKREEDARAHFHVAVMDVATMRSEVSFSTVYLSCRNPL